MMPTNEHNWQRDWDLTKMYNPDARAVHPDHMKRLRSVEAGVAARIADDIDDWNAVHDVDNQADADWIRQRYGTRLDG